MVLIVYEGFPTFTRVIFWGGDEAWVVRFTPIVKNHTNYFRVFMIPTEQMRWRYDIKDEELNYDITEYGILVREYPADYYIEISENPENRVGLFTCFFDGTDAIGHLMVEMKREIARLKQSIRIRESENAKLREQYKIAVERLRSFEYKKLEKR